MNLFDGNMTVLTIILIIGAILMVGYIIFAIRGYWKMFDYAGFPGWLSIVPVLNFAILFKIAKMSSKWLLACLLIIPIPIIWLVWLVKFCKAFEKDSTYLLLSILFGFITVPLVGYGEMKYNFEDK